MDGVLHNCPEPNYGLPRPKRKLPFRARYALLIAYLTYSPQPEAD